MSDRRLVLASFNNGKRLEIAGILTGVELLSPVDFGLRELPPEDGETFLDNALIKAVEVARASGLAVVADDSGLEVDALGGRPGVRSARYAGPGHDDRANNHKLLQDLATEADRTARFVCTAVLVLPWRSEIPIPAIHALPGTGSGLPWEVVRNTYLPDGFTAFAALGEVTGVIIDDPRGTDGFGYDPIFFKPELGLTFAQLSGEAKNRLSHRGQAFRALAPLVSRIFGGRRSDEA